jgi:predicted Zn-dependent peptidase
MPSEPEKINKSYIEQVLEVSRPLFQIGFKENEFPRIGDQSIVYEMAVMIIQDMIFGKSSDFFSDLYEKGLIDNTFQYDHTVERNYSYSSISGESADYELVRDNIADTIKNINKNGLNKNDFTRAKKSYYGRLIKNLNSVEKISHMFNSVYFRDVNMFDYYKLYDKITYESAKDVFNRHFNRDNMVLSVIKGK